MEFPLTKKVLIVLINVFTLFTVVCLQQCGKYEVCPPDKPYCTDAGCVFECPKPFFINATTCLADCGDWFTNNQTCEKLCPQHWFVREVPKLISGRAYIEKHCIQSCDNNEYVFENICLRACPLKYNFIDQRLCGTQCPENKTLLKNFSIHSIIYHECVTNCPQFVEDVYCTDKCSPDKKFFNSTCIVTCPNSHPFHSEISCVQTCPDTTVLIENNGCLRNCTEENPFYMNGTCTDACPETFYITDRNGVLYCEDDCRDGEYIYKNTCLDSCADTNYRNNYLFYLNNTCQDECPSNYFHRLYDPYFVGDCVLTCSEDEFIYNRTCVNVCPEDTFLNTSTCVNKCPTQFPLNCPVQKGSECTGRNPHPNAQSNKLCVSECPNESFIYNSSCVQDCPGTFLVSEQKCVSSCPRTLPLIQIKTITYSTWVSCYNCYPYWQEKFQSKQIPECVSRCREDTVVFNSTCIPKCPERYPYIVNGACQSEACKTKYMYNEPIGIICTDACSKEYFIYNRTCVKECPKNVYLTNKTCHLTACESKYSYNTSSLIICTDNCSEYGFVYHDVCSTFCPYYVFNDTCVSRCPNSFHFIVNETRIVNCSKGYDDCKTRIQYSQCADKCPEHLFKLKDQCLDKCPTSHFAFNHTCVTTCPKLNPFHQPSPDIRNDNGIISNEIKYQRSGCVSKCSEPYTFLDKTNLVCVDSCPNATKFIFLNVCNADCPKGKVLNEIIPGIECADACPSKKLFSNNTCVNKCPQKTFSFNNTECVSECPESQPLAIISNPSDWHCIKSCGYPKVFKNGTCLFELDCTEPYFVFDGICLKSCPDGYYYWDSGCAKRWEKGDIVGVSLSLGIFTLLIIHCRTTLKEYIIVLAMIFFKIDQRRRKPIEDQETYDQEEDAQQLIVNLDDDDEN